MVVVHQNEGVTLGIYHEIFAGGVYLRYGVELPEGRLRASTSAPTWASSPCGRRTGPRSAGVLVRADPADRRGARPNAEIYGVAGQVYAAGVADSERTEVFTYYPHFPSTSGRFPDLAQDRADIKAHILNEQRVLGRRSTGEDEASPPGGRCARPSSTSWLDDHMQSEKVALPAHHGLRGDPRSRASSGSTCSRSTPSGASWTSWPASRTKTGRGSARWSSRSTTPASATGC